MHEFKVGQLVAVKNHLRNTFDTRFISDYRRVKIINKYTLIIESPDGKTRKININNAKPVSAIPISPEDTLHFYRYLCTNVLIENKQFLLLIDIPIQDRAHQITIHQVFTLDIPHGNYSARYDIKTRYFGVTKDATMGVELSAAQFQTCQQANGQFCHISTPVQPLANPPTCIVSLYAKSKASIASKCSLQLCKTTTTALPTQITPDVWILTTPVTAPVNMITMICPEKPMETIAI